MEEVFPREIFGEIIRCVHVYDLVDWICVATWTKKFIIPSAIYNCYGFVKECKTGNLLSLIEYHNRNKEGRYCILSDRLKLLEAFRNACIHGYFRVAQYLYKIAEGYYTKRVRYRRSFKRRSLADVGLRIACWKGYVSLAKFFLDNGADNQWDCLYLARRKGCEELVSLINSYNTYLGTLYKICL